VKALALFLVVASACGRGGSQPPPTRAEEEAGHAAITRLRTALVEELGRAMARGTTEALATCSTKAPAIARELARDGVIVGRATRRPRNPQNLASGWHADALAQFEASVAAGRRFETEWFVRVLPGNRIGYARPLVIQRLCLTCHGDAITPEVTAELAARYPDDRATGYKLGELRGIVWAEFPRLP
jgi:hypothetical protein